MYFTKICDEEIEESEKDYTERVVDDLFPENKELKQPKENGLTHEELMIKEKADSLRAIALSLDMNQEDSIDLMAALLRASQDIKYVLGRRLLQRIDPNGKW